MYDLNVIQIAEEVLLLGPIFLGILVVFLFALMLLFGLLGVYWCYVAGCSLLVLVVGSLLLLVLFWWDGVVGCVVVWLVQSCGVAVLGVVVFSAFGCVVSSSVCYWWSYWLVDVLFVLTRDTYQVKFRFCSTELEVSKHNNWAFDFLLDAMGRKKNQPIRFGSLVSKVDDPQSSGVAEQSLVVDGLCTTGGENDNFRKPFFIEIESCTSAFDEHFDVAKVSLDNRAYQQRAVYWMVSREKGTSGENNGFNTSSKALLKPSYSITYKIAAKAFAAKANTADMQRNAGGRAGSRQQRGRSGSFSRGARRRPGRSGQLRRARGQGSGSWAGRGQPGQLSKWSTDFDLFSECPFGPLGIVFPHLRAHLFDKSILFTLASLFGKPLYTDIIAAMLSRPSITRVLVELDVTQQFPYSVWNESNGCGYYQ
ncbi:hypothetical protein IEQ34_005308 [Dendrobium chrysotoxum]|uniref:Uncharacterized protein n=1 Tax=Dendrobium chrysotoxum TaxID=161865 RepID=A0AAV7HAQ4_DENCH|nr:hypothetical protein IEQ34_005308 [Dendrobium chrysotoxum]